MQHVSEICANCTEETKCRRRDFSEQAWAVLVLWNEVQTGAVDQPICEDCYNELRETLIDRSEEIESALAEPQKKPQAPGKRAAAPTRQKVRKAG
jgi:hypothetical protein